ncbi:RDD family protein [Priestia taiwanensis]|uniref:RDD family protein n=1 Tax=Priestia taiwanensis TaxID=1347902 RepID=A0A917EQW5_9BACI|nr:RDD family protein [Priestia taiwanensis]MBM7363158.1 putative RDD family membrane protein YckC [Priestia taiwanensis]GGE68172.1 RDD family protein [Priestia taiwanensis]
MKKKAKEQAPVQEPEKKGWFGRKKDPSLAPVYVRFGAMIIDLFILSILYGVTVFAVTGNYKDLLGRFGASVGNPTYDLLIATGILALYFIIVPFVWRGRTVGKKILNIRIAKYPDGKLDFQTIIIRFVGNIGLNIALLGIPAIANIYLVWLRKDKRAIHDLIAKTKVVYDKK